VSPLLKAQQEFALDVARLIQRIYDEGFACTYGEALRPAELQELWVAQGRSWTKNSRHLERRAIDLNLFDGPDYIQESEPYAQFGRYWESLRPGKNVHGAGGTWPNRRDSNHFERRVL
jgi:hypothetical protein